MRSGLFHYFNNRLEFGHYPHESGEQQTTRYDISCWSALSLAIYKRCGLVVGGDYMVAHVTQKTTIIMDKVADVTAPTVSSIEGE